MNKMDTLLTEAREAATLADAIRILMVAGIDKDSATQYAMLERGVGGDDLIILSDPAAPEDLQG